MSIYYVVHPSLGKDAIVHAPTTEKARTTFLDYLERNNLISRGDRQSWRRSMVAEKLEYPGDVTSDLELYYGYEEAGGIEFPRSLEDPMEELPSYPTDEFVPEEGFIGPEEYPLEIPPVEAPVRPVRSMSPIARASLGGWVK